MTNQEIYNVLRAGGMTRAGALSTMANMRAESAMHSNNAQDSYGVDDETYTAQVNAGLRDFLDGIGYGLCQWTDSKRKAKLLAFARSIGASIDDEHMQLNFVLKEMREDFSGVWAVVSASDDLQACTWKVLDVYENPKIKNMDERYQYALDFEAEIHDSDTAPAAPSPDQTAAAVMSAPAMSAPDLAVMLLQAVMAFDGYWDTDAIHGVKTPEFRQRIVEYAEAVAGC